MIRLNTSTPTFHSLTTLSNSNFHVVEEGNGGGSAEDSEDIYSVSLLPPPVFSFSLAQYNSKGQEPNIPNVKVKLNTPTVEDGQNQENIISEEEAVRDEIVGFEELVVFSTLAKHNSNIYFNLQLGRSTRDDDFNMDNLLEDFTLYINYFQNIN